MSKPHNLSSIAALGALDIFEVPPTQDSVIATLVTEHKPIGVLSDSTSMIEFEIKSGVDEYILLSETKLHLQVRVDMKKPDTNTALALTDWDKISVTNNFMHSFFKSAFLELNQKTITLAPDNYGYKAYLEGSLGYTADSIRGLTSSFGFFFQTMILKPHLQQR